MENTNQSIPGFGFDPGYEPALHPAATPPNSSSIFGLISKVNKGILKSPSENNKTTMPPERPNIQQATNIGNRLSSSETPSPSQQQAFQNAKSVIENIQRGIWNPPKSDQKNTPPDSGFKVPLGMPKSKTGFANPGNSVANSSGYRGNMTNIQGKSQIVGVPKSLVAYDDDEAMKRSSNFSREKALEEIDRYRNSSSNQRRDNRNGNKEPYKSDFDRYYYGDKSQRDEMSDKIYGSVDQRDKFIGRKNQYGATETYYNEQEQSYDGDEYSRPESTNSGGSYNDYEYEVDDGNSDKDNNYSDQHGAPTSLKTWNQYGISNDNSNSHENQLRDNSSVNPKNVYEYGHATSAQGYGGYTSSYQTNQSAGNSEQMGLGLVTGGSNMSNKKEYYSTEYSSNKGLTDNVYRTNDGNLRDNNIDKRQSNYFSGSSNRKDHIATGPSTTSDKRNEPYEQYLFGESYEPPGLKNTDCEMEYVPTALKKNDIVDDTRFNLSKNVDDGGYNRNSPNLSTTNVPFQYGNRKTLDNSSSLIDGKTSLGIVSHIPVSDQQITTGTFRGVPPPVSIPASIPVSMVPIAPPGLYCKDCGITCADQLTFDTHLKSDIHVLTLQKKAQELFQMGTRPSRFNTDSSGNPLKAPVLQSGGSYTDDTRSLDKDRSESPTSYRNRDDGKIQVIPPKPLGPLETRSVYDTKVTIQWRKRHDDEERLIDKYVIEYRNAREIRWVRVGSTSRHEYEVNGLQEGTDYLFRVYTTNKNEKSEYLESVLITTKKPRGFSPVRGRRRSSRERDSGRRSSRDTDHKSSRGRDSGSGQERDRQRRTSREHEQRSSRDRTRKHSNERDSSRSRSGDKDSKDVRGENSSRKRSQDRSEDERSEPNREERKDSTEVVETPQHDTAGDSQHNNVVEESEEKVPESTQDVVMDTEVSSDTNKEQVECLLYAEFDQYADEPMLGLDHIYEIRSYSATIPPRYVCKLCNNKGSHNVIVRHILGFPHKLNYFKQYDTEIYDLINMIVVKKQQVERANYEACVVEDKIGRGSVRVMMMLNPQDHDGKIVYKDPILVKAPPSKRKKTTEDVPDNDEIVYQSQFDILYNDAVDSGYLPDTTLIGLSFVKEFVHPTQEKDSKFSCTMCNVMCSSNTILNHIVGKRHRFNYLKTYHEELYDQVYNARIHKNELLAEKIKELSAANGPGQIKVKVAKNDRMWRDKNDKIDDITTQQPEDESTEYTEQQSDTVVTMETPDIEQQQSMVPSIKFGIKPPDQQTNVKPVNVLEIEQEKSSKSKETFDWNKENSNLQSRIQNESIVKSNRRSKFIAVYSDCFKRVPVIGTQWVTEFQKPDPKSEPWYMCFMCQHKIQWKTILDHVTSNTHRLNYMKKNEYRHKYDAVQNVLKTNKSEARTLIETFSKEIVAIEGSPVDLCVMLELQVNTEAFRSVAKVQENVKAHSASVVATTANSTIQINIGNTSMPPPVASITSTSNSVINNPTPAISIPQTSTMAPPTLSVPSGILPLAQVPGQPLIQGPSGVRPQGPPPMLPAHVTASVIPQPAISYQNPLPNLSYPPPSTNSAHFPGTTMPNVYAPPVMYPNTGVPRLPKVPDMSQSYGQYVPTAIPPPTYRGPVPSVPPSHFSPTVQAVFQSNPMPNPGPVPPPVQAPTQVPTLGEVPAVQNFPLPVIVPNVSNSSHVSTAGVIRPPNINSLPPWSPYANQGSTGIENVCSRPSPIAMASQPLVTIPLATPLATVSTSISNIPYQISGNNRVQDETEKSIIECVKVSSQADSNLSQAPEKLDRRKSEGRVSRWDTNENEDRSRGIKRGNEEKDLDTFKKTRPTEKVSSAPSRESSRGRDSKEDKSSRERDTVDRRVGDIRNRQNDRALREENDRRMQRDEVRNRRTPPRRLRSRSPQRRRQRELDSPPRQLRRSPQTRRRHSRSPPLRRTPPLRRSPVRGQTSRSPPPRLSKDRYRDQHETRSFNSNRELETRLPHDIHDKRRDDEKNYRRSDGARYGGDEQIRRRTDDSVKKYDDRDRVRSDYTDKYAKDDPSRGFSHRRESTNVPSRDFNDRRENKNEPSRGFNDRRERDYRNDCNYDRTETSYRKSGDRNYRNENLNESQSRYNRDRNDDTLYDDFDDFDEFMESRNVEQQPIDNSAKTGFQSGGSGRHYEPRGNMDYQDKKTGFNSDKHNENYDDRFSSNRKDSFDDIRMAEKRYVDSRRGVSNDFVGPALNRGGDLRSNDTMHQQYRDRANDRPSGVESGRTGFSDRSRETYRRNMADNMNERLDDNMPDPSREEIEALLRRASNMESPAPYENKGFQMNTFSEQGNTDRMYDDRNDVRYGNSENNNFNRQRR